MIDLIRGVLLAIAALIVLWDMAIAADTGQWLNFERMVSLGFLVLFAERAMTLGQHAATKTKILN